RERTLGQRTELASDLHLDQIPVLEDERVRLVADHRGEQPIELRHQATSRTCAIVCVFTRYTCRASTTGRKGRAYEFRKSNNRGRSERVSRKILPAHTVPSFKVTSTGTPSAARLSSSSDTEVSTTVTLDFATS